MSTRMNKSTVDIIIQFSNKEKAMNNTIQKELISDLARDLVAQIAPQEIPLFRAQSEAYFKDPAKALKGETGKDGMLGFGAGEAASFLTPIILAVVVGTIKYITEEVKKSAATDNPKETADIVKEMFKKFRRPEKSKVEPTPTLTPEHLQEIHQKVIIQAGQLKLSESRSKQLADALISSLVFTGLEAT
jgi:uncharacterized protein YneF (UPF0154 family)